MQRLRSLNPYDRHKLIINEYVLNRPGRTKLLQRDLSSGKRDIDVIREHHRFVWDEDEQPSTWEEQLAKKYYDKLFKEFCISDLSRYKENKIALRWRVEKEVIIGKGQFICGNKECSKQEDLRTWEVNFGYIEHGEKKNTLVKLRLCPPCSDKLNYHSKKREIKRLKKANKKKKSKRRKLDKDDEESVSSRGVEDKRYEDNEKDEESKNEETTTQSNYSSDSSDSEGNSNKEKESSDHWTKPIQVEEPSREEEFEKYLEDLLF